VFFYPLFIAVPSAGTTPLLLGIGVLLFQNVNRIDWRFLQDAAPAYIVLIFIPFSYSVITGLKFFIFIYFIFKTFINTIIIKS
jgi:AGZA family xanthine/uracil permease-like MFS transporter